MINKSFYIESPFVIGKELKSQILSSIKDIGDFDVVTLDDVDFNDFHVRLLQNDIFDNKPKVFFLKSLPTLKDKKTFLKKWENLFLDLDKTSNYIVFDNIEINKISNLYKYLTSKCKLFSFKEVVDKSGILSFMTTFLERSKKFIEKENIDLIIDYIGKDDRGYNINFYYNFLNKCILYQNSPNKKEIDKEVIYKLLPLERNKSNWDILDYLLQYDYCNFIRVIKDKLTEDNYLKESEEILNAISWKFNVLLLVLDLNSRGVNNQDIVSEIKKMKKDEKSIYSDYSISSCFNIKNINKTKIANSIVLINLFLLRIRTSITFVESRCLFNMICLYFCDFIKINDLMRILKNE
jgi:hypothetical protein